MKKILNSGFLSQAFLALYFHLLVMIRNPFTVGFFVVQGLLLFTALVSFNLDDNDMGQSFVGIVLSAIGFVYMIFAYNMRNDYSKMRGDTDGKEYNTSFKTLKFVKPNAVITGENLMTYGAYYPLSSTRKFPWELYLSLVSKIMNGLIHEGQAFIVDGETLVCKEHNSRIVYNITAEQASAITKAFEDYNAEKLLTKYMKTSMK